MAIMVVYVLHLKFETVYTLLHIELVSVMRGKIKMVVYKLIFICTILLGDI